MDTVKINHGNTKMIAHRGLSGIKQENTNAAFVAAGNRSYYGIETDVHRTADGQYVIIHDDTTAGSQNGAWDVNVEQVPYRDIQAILLPDRDGSCTPGRICGFRCWRSISASASDTRKCVSWS